MVSLARRLAPDHLINLNSGGSNPVHLADVNDVHTYPSPTINPQPSDTQYAMIGEFGGIGAFVPGKEWLPNGCFAYLETNTTAEEAQAYVKMAGVLKGWADHVSASVYTQITDVETECDGFLNYDRTNKFDRASTLAIQAANQALIQSHSQAVQN